MKKVLLIIFAVAVGILGFLQLQDNKQEFDNRLPEVAMQTGQPKIIFIHHSVGGRWLAHEYGGLVSELNKNNFYVNDITYGWQPSEIGDTWLKKIRNSLFDLLKYKLSGAYKIGDRTDIGDFYDWFAGPDSDSIMKAVYRENNETITFGNHSNSSSKYPLMNPGESIENEVVMIKPCYPNSLFNGNADDPPTASDNPPRNFSAESKDHTVGNCKRVFNDILNYFKKRPDKFFVIATGPPRVQLPDAGKTTRAFNNWLIHDWLRENNYSGKNVMVFDLYNVLTSSHDWASNDAGLEEGNHHRLRDGSEQHVIQNSNNVLSYPRDGKDNHPSPAGLKKATHEFVDLFVYRYKQWKANNMIAAGRSSQEKKRGNVHP
jgi:hypothetical protein